MKNLLLLAVLTTLAGCATQYKIDYETRVSRHVQPPTQDSTLEFKIEPVHNGIIFTIDNKSDSNAKVIWDKSYFITPEGNSFKALNTDLLDEDSKVAQKSSNTSVIPSHASFMRFTTPTTRADRFSYTSVSQFYTSWGDYGTSSAAIFSEEFIRIESYWPITFSAYDEYSQQEEMDSLYQFVRKNNKLGLGLVIEHFGDEREYRFDIRIRKVSLLTESTDVDWNKIYIIEYTLDVNSGNWKIVGKALPEKDIR